VAETVCADRADPQLGGIQVLVAAAARELERRVERQSHVAIGVADDADVGDAQRERAGRELGAAVAHVEHRAGRTGREQERAGKDAHGSGS